LTRLVQLFARGFDVVFASNLLLAAIHLNKLKSLLTLVRSSNSETALAGGKAADRNGIPSPGSGAAEWGFTFAVGCLHR
jgi:hypothetical protein